MHIGELSRTVGRSVHTIRWYERQGLIPGVVRDGGGRRVYAAHHVSWLQFIERLRFTGMSVKDMRTYAGLAEQGARVLPERQALLARHRADVEARAGALMAALALIDDKLVYYREWERDKRRPGWTPGKPRPEAAE